MFYLVIKRIDGSTCCSDIAEKVVKYIENKMVEKKYELDMKSQEKPSVKQIFEILYYLDHNDIVMMTDMLRLANRYKVCFEVYHKTDEAIGEEFAAVTQQLADGSRRKFVEKRKHEIRKFLIYLNNGFNLFETMTEKMGWEDNQEVRDLVFCIWLYANYSKYITRLYEVPVKNNMITPDEVEGREGFDRSKVKAQQFSPDD